MRFKSAVFDSSRFSGVMPAAWRIIYLLACGPGGDGGGDILFENHFASSFRVGKTHQEVCDGEHPSEYYFDLSIHIRRATHAGRFTVCTRPRLTGVVRMPLLMLSIHDTIRGPGLQAGFFF